MNPRQPIRLWIPYFVLVVSLVLTATAAYYVAVTSEAQDSLRFHGAVVQTQSIIRNRLEAYISVLRSGGALFTAQKPVSREAFGSFFGHLDLPNRYPGIRGIGYSIRVPADRVDSLTAAMQASGIDSFRIWPAGTRPEYHAVIFIHTVDTGSVVAYGFDQSTESVRRAALERARDSGRPAATGLVELLSRPGTPRHRGVLVYHPVYRGGAVPATVAERRDALIGFVYAGFRSNEMLNGILVSESRPRVAFSIYDGADTTAANLIYRSGIAPTEEPGYGESERMQVAGRTWTIVYSTSPEFDLVSSAWLVSYIFLGGLAISLILFWLTRSQAAARAAAERSAGELARSQERYRSIIETAPDVIFTVSADGGAITSLSPAFQKLSGWGIDEWLGKPFAPIIHPDDLPLAFERFMDVLGGVTPAPYELRVATQSGAYLNVEFRTKPHYEGGAIIGAIGVARDITERRQDERAMRESEARYRTFVEHSSEAIWRFELEVPVPIDISVEKQIDHFYQHAYLAECNDVMARMYGFEHASDIVGARLDDLLIRTDPDNVAYLTAFVESGYRLIDAESVERDREGNPKYFANNLMGIIEDGTLVRAWGIQRDITERRRAEAAVREAKEAAEAANRAKDQFLAVLSHELRTPLTPVLTAMELLREDMELSESSAALVEMIDRNVGLEARLIDDLLDLTKIANGKLELDIETVDLHALIRAALDISREEIATKNHSLKLELHAERHWVQGDSARLQQVYWNLIKNAVKFTPPGGTITVRSFNDGTKIRTEVSDTGIGIEPHILPHIFNAFEQGEKTITRRFGGLGLGLAISKMLIDLHDGAITAQSKGQGEGSTFAIDLETIEARPLAKSAAQEPLAEGGSQHILLVDDHADTTLVLKTLLERQGYAVTTADSVGSALDAAYRNSFDLIISDIGLPDGTGLDIVKDLRARGPLKAIALSGFGMEEDVARSLDAGFAEHIAKPVNFKILHDAVRRLIG